MMMIDHEHLKKVSAHPGIRVHAHPPAGALILYMPLLPSHPPPPPCKRTTSSAVSPAAARGRCRTVGVAVGGQVVWSRLASHWRLLLPSCAPDTRRLGLTAAPPLFIRVILLHRDLREKYITVSDQVRSRVSPCVRARVRGVERREAAERRRFLWRRARMR